jgi:hypothetical protein
MHAKWISYKYNLTILYKPFIYSDDFMMDSIEQRFSKEQRFSRIIEVSSEDVFKRGIDHNALYVVPYFPESPYELKNEKWPCYFKVNWGDLAFVKVLSEMVSPKRTVPKRSMPRDSITVAMHVRRGGSFEPFYENAFVKFPQDIFYIKALEQIYTMIEGKSLYVFIFTDDEHPEVIAKPFVSIFKDKNIIFDYRHDKNDHNINVLKDFFALTQFDCLIRPDSNFSLCASKLKRYLVEISPGDTVDGSFILHPSGLWSSLS